MKAGYADIVENLERQVEELRAALRGFVDYPDVKPHVGSIVFDAGVKALANCQKHRAVCPECGKIGGPWCGPGEGRMCVMQQVEDASAGLCPDGCFETCLYEEDGPNGEKFCPSGFRPRQDFDEEDWETEIALAECAADEAEHN